LLPETTCLALPSQTAGINYIDPDDYDPQELRDLLAAARATGGPQAADLLVVFIHWGPNWGWRPSASIRALGRALVDAGADVVFGHSAHHLQVRCCCDGVMG
jgi:poly-gamma-glutamate capsule biosynthesis protein CapA/YwtB (metallophosphatase superfamily)